MVPLTFNDFDQHWWLVQPPPPNVADAVLSSMETALNIIADDYDISEDYRKRMILERVLAVSMMLLSVILCKQRREAGHQGQHAACHPLLSLQMQLLILHLFDAVDGVPK